MVVAIAGILHNAQSIQTKIVFKYYRFFGSLPRECLCAIRHFLGCLKKLQKQSFCHNFVVCYMVSDRLVLYSCIFDYIDKSATLLRRSGRSVDLPETHPRKNSLFLKSGNI